jgi:2,3-diketo-5-methylthio-1-phosphopentane phosphatase
MKKFYAGELSAVEGFRRECEACGEVDKTALDAFLDSQEIDPTFTSFMKFCNERELAYYILSDGMDYYIKRILERNGIVGVPCYANTLELVPVHGTSNVKFVPSFPYTDEVCDRCASCKRNHMLSLSSDDDIIVLIGEGYSDKCPARYADVVFAKDELLKYCRQENISYFEYTTFADITKRLQQLLDGNSTRANRIGLRKSRQAEVARREIFAGG